MGAGEPQRLPIGSRMTLWVSKTVALVPTRTWLYCVEQEGAAVKVVVRGPWSGVCQFDMADKMIRIYLIKPPPPLLFPLFFLIRPQRLTKLVSDQLLIAVVVGMLILCLCVDEAEYLGRGIWDWILNLWELQ